MLNPDIQFGVAHVMVDIETIATHSDAPIIQIGAIHFEPTTGQMFESFGCGIHLTDEMLSRADTDTIQWWINDPNRLKIFQSLTRRGKHPEEVFSMFHHWLEVTSISAERGELMMWAQGTTFDITILENNMKRYLGRKPAWPFWSVIDTRTMFNLFGDFRPLPDETQHHDALYDCRRQIAGVHKVFQEIGVAEKQDDA